MSNKSELEKKLKELKEKAAKIKDDLNAANVKKEESFSKKKNVGIEIVELIKKVKDSKKERDSLTKAVRELKKKREFLNKKIKEHVGILKKLQEKRSSASSGPRENPKRLKREIDALEYKIETDGMSFDKEQKLMKVISDLKKKFDTAKKESIPLGNYKELQKDVREKRKEANAIHKKIQDDAKKSQELHEALVNSSSRIDELKKEEKTRLDSFIKEKEIYQNVNDNLKYTLDEMAKINVQIGKFKKAKKEKEKVVKQKSIEEKAKEVEDKIKKGGKLTTEDLLIMQGKE